MILLSKPSPDKARGFLRSHEASAYSYSEVGCTLISPPRGYSVDRERVRLGCGVAVFDAGCRAVRSWEMFELGWVTAVDRECPIEAGRVVGVAARVGPVWMLNACRIAQVIDEPTRRYGFAYGTLRDHVERGEERFLIERDENDDVWYDLFAISRPGRWYVQVFYPLTRLFQRRFRKDSAAAMLRAIQPAGQ